MKIPKFKEFDDPTDIKVYKGKTMFDIAEKDQKKRSYFNLNKKHIKIETLVPSENFILRNVFHLVDKKTGAHTLIVHITDNTVISRLREKIKFLMKIKVPYTEIENCYFDDIQFKEKEEVNIYIHNNKSILDCGNIIDKFQPIIANSNFIKSKNKDMSLDKIEEIVLPDDTGNGGVIIKGP